MNNVEGLSAIILSLSLPIILVVGGFLYRMYVHKQRKEVRRLIIENHADAEMARILLGDPKKQPRKMGAVDMNTLRTACILLGAGLGGFVTWLAHLRFFNIYFWLTIAFGVGVGLLISFLVEIYLYKHPLKQKDSSDNSDTHLS